jgi:hypothetical protein
MGTEIPGNRLVAVPSRARTITASLPVPALPGGTLIVDRVVAWTWKGIRDRQEQEAA